MNDLYLYQSSDFFSTIQGIMIQKIRKILFITILLLVAIFISFSLERPYHRFTQTLSEKGTVLVERIYTLPDLLRETSGLIYHKGLVWSFNDSGGEAEFFAFSMADSLIKQRITVWNGKNYDWEEISQDSSYIYLGDFGNNFGMRKTLTIYKINKAKIPVEKNRAVKAESIHFTYPNYQHATLSLAPSEFDCEAMICYHDSIFVFTKNWVKQTSSVYKIPTTPGKYTAHKVADFDSQGLITAASFNGNQLVLLGYKDYKSFIWRFSNFSNNHFSITNGERIELTPLNGKQTEGITILGKNTYLISSEKTHYPPQLRLVKITEK